MVEYSSHQLDSVFHALSDATRRQILVQLAKKECSVTELAGPHAMSMAAVSKHLKVLEEANLVKKTKNGRVQTCEMNYEPLKKATDLITYYERFWVMRLTALKQLLKAQKPKGKD